MFVYVLLGASEKKLEILEVSDVNKIATGRKSLDSFFLVRLSVKRSVFSTRIPLDKKSQNRQLVQL
jgi:hypothetical protein